MQQYASIMNDVSDVDKGVMLEMAKQCNTLQFAKN